LKVVFKDDENENTSSISIVNFIWNCDKNVLNQVSPQTHAYHDYIKVPLVLLVSLTGTLSGLVMALLKCSTELMSTDGFVSRLSASLFGLGMVAGVLEILVMNLAMQYFN